MKWPNYKFVRHKKIKPAWTPIIVLIFLLIGLIFLWRNINIIVKFLEMFGTHE